MVAQSSLLFPNPSRPPTRLRSSDNFTKHVLLGQHATRPGSLFIFPLRRLSSPSSVALWTTGPESGPSVGTPHPAPPCFAYLGNYHLPSGVPDEYLIYIFLLTVPVVVSKSDLWTGLSRSRRPCPSDVLLPVLRLGSRLWSSGTTSQGSVLVRKGVFSLFRPGPRERPLLPSVIPAPLPPPSRFAVHTSLASTAVSSRFTTVYLVLWSLPSVT